MNKENEAKQQELAKISRNLENAVNTNDFEKSVTLIASGYCLAFNLLYRMHLGSITNPESIIEVKQKIGKSINRYQFGDYIRLNRESDFLKQLDETIVEKKDNKINTELFNNLNWINKERNYCIHPESGAASGHIPDLSKDKIKMQANFFKLFLNHYKLSGNKDYKLSTDFHTSRIRKLYGETQLYRSLNEILDEEEVDFLDVTYLSAKLPTANPHEEVVRYWNRVNERVNEGNLHLRRIMSFDGSDRQKIKKLWFLLNQVPAYFTKLNRQVELGVFETRPSDEGRQNSVELLNMILMYSQNNPNRAHIWLFGSHNQRSTQQNYLHIYGEDMHVLRDMYDQFFLSATKVNRQFIKDFIIRESKVDHFDLTNYEEHIKKLIDLAPFTVSGEDTVLDVYKQIVSDQTKDVENVLW